MWTLRSSLTTLSGTWRDSAAAGAFVLTAGGGVPGNPRPLPVVGTGDITGVTAGAGLTGGGVDGEVAVAVNFATTQQRVTGACASGTFVAGVNQDGTVTCTASTGAGGGDITEVIAGTGLTGGAASGAATLSVAFAGPGTAATVARSDHSHASAGTANTALGASALVSNTTGSYNTAVGYSALDSNTIGSHNTASGTSALASNTTGTLNTAIGVNALYSSTTASNNVAVGTGALLLTSTGGENVAVGALALLGNGDGVHNVAVGHSALSGSQHASRNTAVGHRAIGETTGNDNTAMGCVSARREHDGLREHRHRRQRLEEQHHRLCQHGDRVRHDAGQHRWHQQHRDGMAGTPREHLRERQRGSRSSTRSSAAPAASTSAWGGGRAGLTSGNGNLYLGQDGGVAAESNATYIRNVFGCTSSGGALVFVQWRIGKLGTLTSSIRFKEDVQAIGDVRDAIQALRPVSFYYKAEFDDGSRVQQVRADRGGSGGGDARAGDSRCEGRDPDRALSVSRAAAAGRCPAPGARADRT